jgi:hypothetical protein
MPSPSLKDKLIDKLREIEDPALLAEVSNLFEIHEPETLYKVNPAQKKSIEKGIQQAQNGQTIDNDQANKESDKWIGKCLYKFDYNHKKNVSK